MKRLIDIERGLMLIDKWQAGPFTDTDATEALDIWLWENMGEIASIMEQQSELIQFAEQVARSACLEQEVGGNCICFSCEAKRLLEKAGKTTHYS